MVLGSWFLVRPWSAVHVQRAIDRRRIGGRRPLVPGSRCSVRSWSLVRSWSVVQGPRTQDREPRARAPISALRSAARKPPSGSSTPRVQDGRSHHASHRHHRAGRHRRRGDTPRQFHAIDDARMVHAWLRRPPEAPPAAGTARSTL